MRKPDGVNVKFDKKTQKWVKEPYWTEPKPVKKTKTCNACKQEMPLTSFQRDRHMSDGRKGKCKVCEGKYREEYATRMSEHTKEAVRAANRRAVKRYNARRKEAVKELINRHYDEYQALMEKLKEQDVEMERAG